ncbi:hypothetical protein T459_02997 [Capsicum annuum]|uniref:Uncharacterized protein n=1 Tax=Capsicum annuum TaxID=4072 RepID=A0A2G3ALK0_CAPAN|nr:hypothetical protein T459_02997 [Capsicum annuum]
MSLLSPTKLNTVSFSAIERLRPGVEFDLLAVVSNCSALQYTTDLSKPFREAIVIDQRVEDNEQMLISYTLRSSSASTSSLTLALFEDVVFPISIISDLSSQTFPVEGKISLPDRPQFFYLLTCSHYNHFVRIKTKKMVQYFNCKLERMLVPRCHFEVNITNTSDIISAIVSETIAETMLSLTSEQIYENVVAQELTSKRGLIPSKRILFPSTPLEIRAKRRRRVISRALSSIQKSKIATPLSVCCTEKRTISKREQHELKKVDVEEATAEQH